MIKQVALLSPPSTSRRTFKTHLNTNIFTRCMFRSLFVGALVASSLTGTAYVTAQTNAETAKEAFAVANAKAKAGDPITCKMKGNEDSELDCFPMCVCHKFAWTLEFQPQLRQEVKTTKLCEHWIQSELMDEACMVTCASVSHAVYGAQGTDPMVCEHVSTELTKVMSFKEERASSTTKKRLGKPGAKSTAAGRKWESLVGKAKWMPTTAPPHNN
jgi:hypothetical protein